MPGQRKLVPYENPRGRRVNALVAYRPLGQRPTLRYLVHPRTLASGDVLHLLERLASPLRPCVVVLDNAGIHASRQVREQLPHLARRGLTLYYLPAYSPELNEVEAVFQVLKQYEMPERSYPTLAQLLAAIRRALASYSQRLHRRGQKLCPGA